MYIDRKVSGFLCAIAKSHCCYHVSFGSNAKTRAAAKSTLTLYLFPQMHLGSFHLITLRVTCYLLHYQVNLLQLKVNNVIHKTLSYRHVFAELFKIEASLVRERILHIIIKIDTEQTTAVIRTKRYLSTWVCTYRPITQIGIAGGNTLTNNRIPEQDTRLSTLPCIVNNLFPKGSGVNLLTDQRIITVNWELLHIRFVIDGSIHEFVVNLHGNICTGNLPFGHLCIDKGLTVRMFNANGEHQCPSATILCDLTGRIAVTLHEWDKSC